MKTRSQTVRRTDWKNEKHVPVMDAPLAVEKGSIFSVAGRCRQKRHLHTPRATMKLKTELFGTLMAACDCNIHGLWQRAHALSLE